MKSIRTDLSTDISEIELLILADYHYADPNSDHNAIRKDIDYVNSHENAYCVLAGDLMDCALKSSLGDVYSNLSPMDELKAGIGPLDLLAEKTNIFPSKGEARKMIQANGFSMNKEKLTDPATPITDGALLNGKYLLFQKGKKNYYLVVAK